MSSYQSLIYPSEFLNPVPSIGLLFNKKYHDIVLNSESLLKQDLDSVKYHVISSEALEQSGCKGPKKKLEEKCDSPHVLKRRWFQDVKTIPSVIIMFVEIKQDEIKNDVESWRSSIVQKIEQVRKQTEGRPTRYALILIEQGKEIVNDPLQSPQVQMDEYVKSFRQFIDQKALFIVDVNSFAEGLKADNFQKIIFELSSFYYRDLSVRLRKLKKEIKISEQSGQFVRHRFKMGYYQEIVRNRTKALKYYSQAYNTLLELTGYDVREIKVVSDFLNYKLYLLRVREEKLDMAIKQFSKHMNWFRNMSGDPKLIYDHYQMMYDQYRCFGELLDRVTSISQNKKLKQRMKQNQYQLNPGFYFQSAAESAKQRKHFAFQLCEGNHELIRSIYNFDNFPVSDTVEREKSVLPCQLHLSENCICTSGFIGDLVEAVTDKERDLIKDAPRYIRYMAKALLFEHSQNIIEMYTKASLHIKNVPATQRLKLFIGTKIGEEYCHLGNYERAKEFFDAVIPTYRRDQWFDLLTNILKLSLKCAEKLDSPQDYISIASHLYSNKMDTTTQEKRDLWNQVKKYQETLVTPLIIDLTHHDQLLKIKGSFDVLACTVHDEIICKLALSSTAPDDLEFSKIQIMFTDRQMDIVDETPVHIPSSGHVLIEKKMKIGFTCKDFRILYVVLHYGKNPKSICFRWNFTDHQNDLIRNANDYLTTFTHNPIISVNSPAPGVGIQFQHLPPAIINEYYCMKMIIHSNTDHVTKGKLTFGGEHSVLDSEFNPVKEKEVGEIEPDQKLEIIIFLKTLVEGMITIPVEFKYNTKEYAGTLEFSETFTIESKSPFKVSHDSQGTRPSQSERTYKLINPRVRTPQTQATHLKGFPTDDPFILISKIKNSLPFDISLKSVKFSPINPQQISCLSPTTIDVEKQNQGSENIFQHGNAYTVMHVLKCSCLPKIGEHEVQTGTLTFTMKRSQPLVPEVAQYFDYVIEAPVVSCYNIPVSVRTNIPDQIYLHQASKMYIHLTNNSNTLQPIILQVSESTSFTFSGPTKAQVDILPLETEVISFTLYPLKAGHISLPQVSLRTLTSQLSLLNMHESWEVFVQSDTKNDITSE